MQNTRKRHYSIPILRLENANIFYSIFKSVFLNKFMVNTTFQLLIE